PSQPGPEGALGARTAKRGLGFRPAGGRREGRGGENVQIGLHCGRKWDMFAAASRGGGAPPTPPPRLLNQGRRCPPAGRSLSSRGVSAVSPFRGTFDHTLDAKHRLTVPARYRSALADGVVLAMPVDLKPCIGVWRPEEYDQYTRSAIAELPPL